MTNRVDARIEWVITLLVLLGAVGITATLVALGSSGGDAQRDEVLARSESIEQVVVGMKLPHAEVFIPSEGVVDTLGFDHNESGAIIVYMASMQCGACEVMSHKLREFWGSDERGSVFPQLRRLWVLTDSSSLAHYNTIFSERDDITIAIPLDGSTLSEQLQIRVIPYVLYAVSSGQIGGATAGVWPGYSVSEFVARASATLK